MEREAKEKISILTSKYNKHSKASGLPTKMERTKSALRVDKLKGNGTIEKNRSKKSFGIIQSKISNISVGSAKWDAEIKKSYMLKKNPLLNYVKIQG